MPAEWEPHEATWIAWPHNRDDWPGKFQPIPWIYAVIVRHLARGEHVRIIVNGRAHQRSAERTLKDAHVALERVQFFCWKTDRVWTRDSGPIFVAREKDSALAMTHWQFNGWAKYSNHQRDEKLPALIAQKFALESWQPKLKINGKLRRIVLEGGSIDVNGRGTMLTTEECLLSDVQQRNPDVKRYQLEQLFADYLGVTKTIWLGNGIAGDDTHGHVDDISRFVSPDTIVTVVAKNASDPNHAPFWKTFFQNRQRHFVGRIGEDRDEDDFVRDIEVSVTRRHSLAFSDNFFRHRQYDDVDLATGARAARTHFAQARKIFLERFVVRVVRIFLNNGQDFVLRNEPGEIDIERGAATENLARKLALELVNELKAPQWKLASAQLKNTLADAIVSNDAGKIAMALSRIGSVEGSKLAPTP